MVFGWDFYSLDFGSGKEFKGCEREKTFMRPETSVERRVVGV